MGLLVPTGSHPQRKHPRYVRLDPEPWNGNNAKKHPFHLLKNPIVLPDKFAWDDLAQQIVGALVLAAPLAVTEEVWHLSAQLDFFRIGAIVALTLLFNILLIYYAKYQLVESERILGIIPTRLFSQMIVSYTAAGLMLTILGVIGYEVVGWAPTLKLIIFVGLFSNIGAGAADLLK
jgi:uncharacterized membrane protein